MSTRAYTLTILVIDHDALGPEAVIQTLEHQKYPNHCISPEVIDGQEVEIGEWYDGHPLNTFKPDRRARWLATRTRTPLEIA